MNRSLMSLMLWFMPKRLYTSLLGSVVKQRWSAKLIPWYLRHFAIDATELAVPPSAYNTLGEFFSRRLQPQARPISPGIVSPVDGTVSTLGQIRDGELLQVKGLPYTLAELLADDEAARPYHGGQYLTLYLSPRDYHRIHAPIDCVAERCCHVPGSLYPVNRHGVMSVPRLFVRNERVVTYFSSTVGPFAMVKVGAAGVGTVVVPYGPVRSRRQRQRGQRMDVTCDVAFARGEEVAYFALGSTVVLLFPPAFPICWQVQTGMQVRMGETIAQIEKC